MADPVLVQHPDFPTTAQEVPAAKAKEWEEAGWVRVKRADEDKVKATLPLPPVT